MKILEYTDELIFDSKQVVVSDEHYNIVKCLHDQYCNDVKVECSPINQVITFTDIGEIFKLMANINNNNLNLNIMSKTIEV